MSNIINPLNNPFDFSDHSIRTATDECGNAWFCAKDVFEALGVVWKSKSGTLKNYPEKWIRPCHFQGQSGVGEMIFISEPAVYQAAFTSRKPQAMEFTQWVCEEVLPSIRQNGFYGQISPANQIQLRYQKIKLIEQLSTKDSFVFESVMTSLRNVCNQLGEIMPSRELIGQEQKQLLLGL